MIPFLEELPRYLVMSPFLAYGAAYLGGLLASAEPCLYTVLPVTIGFIGSAAGGSRKKAFFLSLVYVLGLAATYTTLGLVAAFTGSLFGEYSSSPWMYFILGNLCLFLGLATLEVFELPQFVLQGTPTKGGGPWMTAFIIGLSAGFVAGPCTATVLGFLLTFAAQSGNMLYGGSLLFTFSFGLGTLLLLAGTFVGFLSSLPPPGPWMVRIKKFFGFVMILAAEYFFINAGMRMP